MTILSFYVGSTGEVGYEPQSLYLSCNDSISTVTTSNYLQGAIKQGFNVDEHDIVNVIYGSGNNLFGLFTPTVTSENVTLVPLLVEDANGNAFTYYNFQAGGSGHAGTVASFPATASTGSLVVAAVANSGDYVTTISNAAMGQASVISIPDPGAATANFLLDTMSGGQTITGKLIVNATTASATPGTIRSILGSMTESNTTMTSGNLVGVRGSVNYVGASGGFLYGVQGKLIPTGSLSGSSWNAAVFGQFDISAATINAGQLACIWGDMGATSGTLTDVTGLRMFAGTNTTAATLNSMIYLFGKSSQLFELSGSSSTYISTGGATASGTIKKIAITIDGVQYYLQAATVYS